MALNNFLILRGVMRLRIKTTNKLLEPVIMLLSFFLGFEEGGFQLILLSIANEFELSNASMGSLVSVQYAAIIIAPLMFRNFADKVGKKIITVLFAMVFIVGCFTIIWTLSIIVVIIGIFILGCGFSVCESSVIAALADSYGIRSGKYINISQSFFSVGAVVSPLITNFGMVYLGVDWRVVFAISGCGYLFLMIPLLFTKFAIDIPIQSLSDYRRFTTFSMILFPTFLCLLVTILIYVSMENGLTFFLDSMFIKVLDAPKLAAFSISLFWLAMVPSRLLASLFNRHQITLLIFCFFGSTVLLIILALNSSPYISLAICFAL